MNALSNGIYDALYANSGILAAVSTRIYRSVAPQQATYPLIVIQQIGGGTLSETPIKSVELIYLITAVSSTSAADAETLAGYIEIALHMQTLTVSGWTNIWTAVTNHLETVEVPSITGAPLWQAGRFVEFRLST